MKKNLIFSFSLVGQIGFATAIPLVALGLFGRYLDRIFDTGPYLFLAGLIIATTSIYFILKQIAQKAIENFSK